MSVAETVLRRTLAKINGGNYKNEDISLKSLTSGGANYTSALFSVTLTSKHEDDLKLFAKVANVNRELRELMNVKLLFDTEQFVYKNLVETYNRIQEKHDLAPEYRYTFPKFYGGDETDGEETVVLEDLISKGYKPYSRFKCIDWDHIVSCVKVLARFHALSFAFAKEKPDHFAVVVEKLTVRIPEKKEDPAVKGTWMKMVNSALQVAKEEHKANISKILCYETPPEEVYKFRMPLSTTVLCHGDFRISNILLKEQVAVIQTILTMSDAKTVLRRILTKIIDEKHHKDILIKSLPSDGANYTSNMFSVTIKSNYKEDLKLFAKVATANGEIRDLINVRRLFETEQIVYNNLAETYDRIQKKHNLAPEHIFTFPKYYGGHETDEEETVVLEDLISKGYKPYSRLKSIDWDHIASCIKSLARFHGLSFAFAKEDPDNFSKASEVLKPPKLKDKNDPVFKEVWMNIMDAAVQVARDEHKQKISNFLYREISSKESHIKITTVLCHGDFKVSNILFKEMNGNIETIVVDYQTVHTGCPAIDLLYLEFMGTDEEFRRENHERLLDYYYEELTLSLDRLDLDVNEVYPRETFDKELREMLPTALRTASFILPLVLVEADRAPTLDKSGVEDFALSPSQQFAERYSGLISDCVRWGVI